VLPSWVALTADTVEVNAGTVVVVVVGATTVVVARSVVPVVVRPTTAEFLAVL
jgi:hypothetical protein